MIINDLSVSLEQTKFEREVELDCWNVSMDMNMDPVGLRAVSE